MVTYHAKNYESLAGAQESGPRNQGEGFRNPHHTIILGVHYFHTFWSVVFLFFTKGLISLLARGFLFKG